jgi:hypothetical protein
MVAVLVAKSRFKLLDELTVVDGLPLRSGEFEIFTDKRGDVESYKILERYPSVLPVYSLELPEFSIEPSEGFEMIAAVRGGTKRPKIWLSGNKAIVAG